MNKNTTSTEKSKFFGNNSQDRKTCMTLITAVYSPLAIILGAAAALA